MVDARIDMGEQGWYFYSGMHALLLRMAGRVPDEWLAQMRRRLAGGDLAELADTVAGSVAEFGVSLTREEATLVGEMVRVFAGDRDPAGLDLVNVSPDTAATGHRFFPAPADVLASAAARIPPRLDLSGRPDDDPWELPPEFQDLALQLIDIEDLTSQSLVSDEEDVLSVARAWRFPPDGPVDGGVRVVLVEVADFAPAWDVTGLVQQGLARHGETAPQVEVFWTSGELPPYHRAALAGSALLWRSARHTDPGR